MMAVHLLASLLHLVKNKLLRTCGEKPDTPNHRSIQLALCSAGKLLWCLLSALSDRVRLITEVELPIRKTQLRVKAFFPHFFLLYDILISIFVCSFRKIAITHPTQYRVLNLTLQNCPNGESTELLLPWGMIQTKVRPLSTTEKINRRSMLKGGAPFWGSDSSQWPRGSQTTTVSYQKRSQEQTKEFKKLKPKKCFFFFFSDNVDVDTT